MLKVDVAACMEAKRVVERSRNSAGVDDESGDTVGLSAQLNSESVVPLENWEMPYNSLSVCDVGTIKSGREDLISFHGSATESILGGIRRISSMRSDESEPGIHPEERSVAEKTSACRVRSGAAITLAAEAPPPLLKRLIQQWQTNPRASETSSQLFLCSTVARGGAKAMAIRVLLEVKCCKLPQSVSSAK